jgi:hypothetical protein
VAKPDEVLLVVDAMTGQEAANLVKSFNDDIGITGAILTKMDGDTRGGCQRYNSLPLTVRHPGNAVAFPSYPLQARMVARWHARCNSGES